MLAVQYPTNQEWMEFHDFSKENSALCPDFSSQTQDYYKKRKNNLWKIGQKELKRELFVSQKGNIGTPTEHIKTYTHNLRLYDLYLVSPKGSRKYFRNILELVHLDPTHRADIGVDVVIHWLEDDDGAHATYLNLLRPEEPEAVEDPS